MELVGSLLGETRMHAGYCRGSWSTQVSMLVPSISNSVVLGELLDHPLPRFSHL